MASYVQHGQPIATAYALGLLSTAGPRVLRVLLLWARRQLDSKTASWRIIGILRHATDPRRFPAFCGVLVGGSTILQSFFSPLLTAFLRVVMPARQVDAKLARRIVRFFAALVSASVAFRLLNSAPTADGGRQSVSAKPHQPLPGSARQLGPFDDPAELESHDVDNAVLDAKSLSMTDLAGRTMDLTLFAAIRALDVVVSSVWDSVSPRRRSRLRGIPKTAPVALFCFSAATIMHAWFYTPLRLPKAYNQWIFAAAELDKRLLLALRHARFGTFVYGKDTGMAPLLGSMCKDYGLPEVDGDPAKTIPVPCELIHMCRSKSCEIHAAWRFWRGWLFAAKMHVPLQLVVLARQARKLRRPGEKLRLRLPLPVVLRACFNAAHSSAFLGAFISLFYYGVCLSRTRLGSKLFSQKTVTPQMWDSGLCVLAGCLLCGTSILVEQSRRRLEVLFFVLPRAAAIWFPRRYLPENVWKEHVAFALSAAVLLTAAQENPRRVRGIFGKLLHRTLTVA